MMQLNSKELKNFRETLALWHIADFLLADELCQKQSRVKNIKGLIESNNTMLEKLASGSSVGVLKSKEELETENIKFESQIKAENDAYAKLLAEQKVDLNKGYDLVTDTLLNAIKGYLADIYNDECEKTLVDNLVKWFADNGAKGADAESVKPYMRALGQSKNSARNKVKTNKHNGVGSNVAIKTVFLGAICDEPTLNKLLPIHKFITVIERKTNNK